MSKQDILVFVGFFSAVCMRDFNIQALESKNGYDIINSLISLLSRGNSGRQFFII